MKMSVVALTLIFGSLAHAASVAPGTSKYGHALSAQLDKFKIDKNLTFPEGEVEAASITVDLPNKSVRLGLTVGQCPKGRACASPAYPKDVVLPVTGTKRSSCGAIVITAGANNSSVDAGGQEIKVTDAAGSACKAKSPTTVVYETIGSRGIPPTKSTFRGPELTRAQ